MDASRSLQDQFAPDLICFGCGPGNENGLQIKSFVKGENVVCRFVPSQHHQSFPGMMNGGIIGALLDCHMNWTAAWKLMLVNQQQVPPCTVTAEYSVEFKAPTPSNQPLDLQAWVTEASQRKAVIQVKIGVWRSGHGMGKGNIRCRETGTSGVSSVVVAVEPLFSLVFISKKCCVQA